MKPNRIAWLVALVMGSCGLPAMVAQTTTSPQQTPQTTTGPQTTSPQQTPAPTTPPTLPPDESSKPTANPPANDQPQPVQQQDDSKIKHDGGKSDVNAVGNRKIGGRGIGDWYSVETEIRMGKQYAQMVESSSKMVQD